MNCPDCKRDIPDGYRACPCGWKGKPDITSSENQGTPPGEYLDSDISALARAFRKVLDKGQEAIDEFNREEKHWRDDDDTTQNRSRPETNRSTEDPESR